MLEIVEHGVFYTDGTFAAAPVDNHAAAAGRRRTMAYQILSSHSAEPAAANGELSFEKPLALKFDALASHDITFVNIIQTAKVSGLTAFPVPYVLTNCHNSLCAVGGTINEDDHLFGLSAAKKYGGIYVPPHLAVIHSYMREAMAGVGRMILGSDSHTRYGALGTMGVGEGGGELVKQLLGQCYRMAYPRVIAVELSGEPRRGVGPQDAALALIGAVFSSGFAKNAVLEFVGGAIARLPMDFRAGVDVMTTETACWSSIWQTDETTEAFLSAHGRPAGYKKLAPGEGAYYDGLIRIDLSTVKPMIALPFHPSNVYEIDTFLDNAEDILAGVEKAAAETTGRPFPLRHKVLGKGRVAADQGIIAGCAGGTFDNITAAADILTRGPVPAADNGFSLSVYPGSQPVMLELTRNGAAADLIAAGAVLRSAFCGPCFGAGDVPATGCLSVRHTTRNFPNREGSKPGQGQIAGVALMDARSIAATAANGGILTSAERFAAESGWEEKPVPYRYDDGPYRRRVYNGAGAPNAAAELVYGPNIVDWPDIPALGENLLVKIVSFITDPVTTTDELIPSGETSSFRSNPVGLAEYTLSRKDPGYAARAKAVRDGNLPELEQIINLTTNHTNHTNEEMSSVREVAHQLGSAIYAVKPGDGSAREQAASCQRVLGGVANFASEYATKRYRSNLINWGILPFTLAGAPPFKNGDCVYIPGIRRAIQDGAAAVEALILSGKAAGAFKSFTLEVPRLEPEERDIMLAGCLINYNRNRAAKESR